MKPIKFNHKEWTNYAALGWKLSRIPAHLDGLAQRTDGTWVGQSPVMGYIGQAIDEPDVPVIQLPEGKVRKCYCLYMIPPRTVLRYRRYIVRSVLDDIAVLSWPKDAAGYPDPSVYRDFVRWVDLEWQEEVL